MRDVMIRYECPECGESLAVSAARAGSVYVCGTCGAETRVPGEPPATGGDSLARHIARATRRWSGITIALAALAALIGRDLVREYLFGAPITDAVTTPSIGLSAARANLRELASTYRAAYTWRRSSAESITIRVTAPPDLDQAGRDELVGRILDVTTGACDDTTFIVEMNDRKGRWLCGGMRRGGGATP